MIQRIPIPPLHPQVRQNTITPSSNAIDEIVDVFVGSNSDHEYKSGTELKLKTQKQSTVPMQTTYSCWKLTKATPKGREAPSWRRAERTQMTLPSDELAKQVRRMCKAQSLTDTYEALSVDQRRHVEVLLKERRRDERNPDADWQLSGIHRELFNNMRTMIRETKYIRVILERGEKQNPETSRSLTSNIIDLNDQASLISLEADVQEKQYPRPPQKDATTQSNEKNIRESLFDTQSISGEAKNSLDVSTWHTEPTPLQFSPTPRHASRLDDSKHPFLPNQQQQFIPQTRPIVVQIQNSSEPVQNRQYPQQLPLQQHPQQQAAFPNTSENRQQMYSGVHIETHPIKPFRPEPPYNSQTLPPPTQHLLQKPPHSQVDESWRSMQQSAPSSVQRPDLLAAMKRPPQVTHQSGSQAQQAVQQQGRQFGFGQSLGQTRQIFSESQTQAWPLGKQQQLQPSATQQPCLAEQSPTDDHLRSPQPQRLASQIHAQVHLPAQPLANQPAVSFSHNPAQHRTPVATMPPDGNMPPTYHQPESLDDSTVDSSEISTDLSFASHEEAQQEQADIPKLKEVYHSADFGSQQYHVHPNYAHEPSVPLTSLPAQEVRTSGLQPKQKPVQNSELLRRREDILFWRTQAQLSQSRSSSSLNDQSSTLASPEQSTPPTSISEGRHPFNRSQTDRSPTKQNSAGKLAQDLPQSLGQQSTAHKCSSFDQEWQQERPFLTNRTTRNDYQRRPCDDSYDHEPSYDHLDTEDSHRRGRALPTRTYPPRGNNDFRTVDHTNGNVYRAPRYERDQMSDTTGRSQYTDSETASLLDKMSKRLEHIEAIQAEEATRKAHEEAEKRREMERKEAYRRGVEDAMAWKKARPGVYGNPM